MKAVLKISRFIVGIIALTIATTTLAGSIVVVALQSESFRAWLIKSGLEYIQPYVLGKIEIGDISGNPVFGLKLLNVKLISSSGSNVISTPQIDLNYQLLPFTKKNILAKVFIHNPDINLTRSNIDSVWNFTQLFKPSNDTTSKPFNFNIEVSSFEIENGNIHFDDNTILPINYIDSSLDYSHINLQDLNVSLSAKINSKSQNVIIQNLKFYLPKNDIRVLELSGDFAVDSTGTKVDKLRLETDKTLANITASIDSLNILKPENMKEWKKFPVKLSLSSPRISTLELRKFIPSLNFLNGAPSIELEVLGNYGNIDIKKLQLGLSSSKLNLTGNLKNLNDPDKLYLDVKISETKLSHKDVITFIPGLNLPNLKYLGNVDLKEATFIGEPLNFKATINAFTAIGKVIGGAQLDLRGKEMLYTGDVYLTHANAAPAFKNNNYKSDFTGRIVINGEGMALNKLKASTRIEAEASSIGDYKFKKLFLDCKASNGGVLNFDTLMIAFDKKSPLEEFLTNSDSNLQFIPKEIKTIFGNKIQIDKKVEIYLVAIHQFH
ncbi:MAG: hypothetical protein IPP65_02075 [Chlorobi bacterium]|nr:hypothetical protein [Chlorobiota bacterium]